MTACADQAGTDESSRRAADRVRQNVGTTVGAPSISEGDALLQF